MNLFYLQWQVFNLDLKLFICRLFFHVLDCRINSVGNGYLSLSLFLDVLAQPFLLQFLQLSLPLWLFNLIFLLDGIWIRWTFLTVHDFICQTFRHRFIVFHWGISSTYSHKIKSLSRSSHRGHINGLFLNLPSWSNSSRILSSASVLDSLYQDLYFKNT